MPPAPGRPAAAQGRAARPRGLALSQQSCCSGAGLGTLLARSWLVVVLVAFFSFFSGQCTDSRVSFCVVCVSINH